MHVTKLSVSNVLRLNAIEITPDPDGNLIIIGGENEQGKTSVLDSIFWAMGGRKAKHSQPLKRGAKKGFSTVELDNGIVVTKTINSKGNITLKVEGQEGSPQRILDNLTGQLTFDPLAFSAMEGVKQKKVLTEILGLDFTELDEKRKQKYNERTEVNRDMKRLEAELEGLEFKPSAPKEEVSVSRLMEELDRVQQLKNNHSNLSSEIERIKLQYKKLINEAEELKIVGKELQVQLKELPELVDEKDIQNQITNAETINNQISDNIQYKEVETKLGNETSHSDDLSLGIEAIDHKKEKALSSAKFPIPELSFDEDGVLYKSIPFSQCSSAESLRVSVAMGIAMNPELKVLLIRDGSLLDDKNLAMIAKMAEESDCQVWLERVGKGEECSVIIEDGYVEGQVIKEKVKPKEVKGKKKKDRVEAENVEEVEDPEDW